MHKVLQAGMVFLEILFVAGWTGSVIVVLISGVEDLKTVFTKDKQVDRQQPIEG